MKKAVKRLLVLFLALTFIVTDLAVAPVTAQAAGTLKFTKSVALMKGEEITPIISLLLFSLLFPPFISILDLFHTY